jgi:hypothetical protein
MKAIDMKDDSDGELLDDARQIPSDQVDKVCLIGQADRTCKYITIQGERGFVCAKGTSMGDMLDNLAKNNKITAKSDNCEGLGNATKEKGKEENSKGTQDDTED